MRSVNRYFQKSGADFMAAARAGAIFNPINYRLAARELAFILEDGKANGAEPAREGSIRPPLATHSLLQRVSGMKHVWAGGLASDADTRC
ncbi:hypothetical protein UB46_18550 [Burkholderiaceae bacterium 16]|nr:hypothetical protein UB46_18550 [Burkholderiaceae bacterium 16]